MASESKTAVVAALIGNAALALLKGATAAMTGSAAMLAETFHSIADTGNQVLLFVGMWLSQRPPDRSHPFGYGMNTYFWAFVVSAMLFTVGGAFSIWEAVHKFLEPPAYVASPGAFFVLAAAGLALAQLTGRPQWDAAASAAIGLILIAVATFLAYENYSLLLGEPATAEQEAEIRTRLAADPAVRDVVSLHTMHLGPNAVLVSARVWFRPELTARQIEEAVLRLEDAARAALAGTRRRLILIEPARPDAAQ